MSEPLWFGETWSIIGEDELVPDVPSIEIANMADSGPEFRSVCDVRSGVEERSGDWRIDDYATQAAALICAAPELYRSLRNLLIAMGEGGKQGRALDLVDMRYVREAEAAMRKAREVQS